LVIQSDRVYFALTILVMGIVLAAAYRFTTFGLMTRAAAETERGAVVSGLTPQRIAAANWIISGVVAAISGILIAPIVPLVPISYTLFIVPALAAALVGQFRSLAAAVLGGLAIGMVQSEATFLQTQHSWLPSSGLPDLLPLVIVLLVLLIRARPLASRGIVLRAALGTAPRPEHPVRAAVVGAAIGTIAILILGSEWRLALTTSLILAVITLSLVVVTGYCGQISFAQLTLAGVAGFLLSPLTERLGIPFPLAPLLATLGAMGVGVVVGLPALRVRGLSLGVVTLTLAVAIESIWFENNNLNGGNSGAAVAPAHLFGLDLGIGSGLAYPRPAFCLLCLVILTSIGLGVAALRRSRLGVSMLAVRANERSAAAAGVDVTRVKLIAFAIGSGIAGLGGALLAYQQTSVSYDSFAALAGLSLFAIAYLAGITSISGAILGGLLGLGGLVFYIADRLSVGSWYSVVTGIVLVAIVIFHPEGLAGWGHRIIDRVHTRAATPDAGGNSTATAMATPLKQASPASSPPPIVGPAVLSVTDLSVRYDNVTAVDSVSFDVLHGEIVGLIGPNGAGKTTLMDALTGYVNYTGSVRLDAAELGLERPHRRARLGLSRTFQALELYDDLTVVENVLVGLSAGGNEATLRATLELVGLDAVAQRPARDLSQGQRQLVSVARALVGRPTVVLLDEPAGGLDSNESMWLGARLRAVRDGGVAVVLVDHDMGLVLSTCDRLIVLDFGRIIADGPPDAVRSDPRVIAAYLGQTHGGANEPVDLVAERRDDPDAAPPATATAAADHSKEALP
jgi:ABC-type branched-subunit amino acid transport system ATPase component/ABC-type branched-subunit amino acid transport system permease subunit